MGTRLQFAAYEPGTAAAASQWFGATAWRATRPVWAGAAGAAAAPADVGNALARIAGGTDAQLLAVMRAAAAQPLAALHGAGSAGATVAGSDETGRLALVAHITASAVFITDAQSRIEWVNDAFSRLSGYALDEARGRASAELLHGPGTDARTAAWMQAQIDAGTGFRDVEVLLYGKGGAPYWTLLEVQPVRDHLGAIVQFVGVQVDITARKRAEEEARSLNAELQASLAALAEVNRQTRVVGELRDALQGCDSIDDIFHAARQHVGRLIPASSGALYAMNAAHTHLDRRAVWGTPQAAPRCIDAGACRAPDVAADAAGCRARRDGAAADAGLCLPLAARGETFGALCIELPGRPQDGPQADAQRQLAGNFAEHLASALANLHLRDTLRSQATRDALTGLYNRRHLDEALEREVRRALRKHRPLTLCIFDVDHFKRFNDTWGHDAGDSVLRAVAAQVSAQVRGDDFVCRFGGEEFVIVMPEAEAAAVLPRLEALRAAIAAHLPMHRGAPLDAVTVSMGVAMLPDHGASAGELLREADRALYRAKAAGRNRVVLAAGDAEADFVRTLARELV